MKKEKTTFSSISPYLKRIIKKKSTFFIQNKLARAGLAMECLLMKVGIK